MGKRNFSSYNDRNLLNPKKEIRKTNITLVCLKLKLSIIGNT